MQYIMTFGLCDELWTSCLVVGSHWKCIDETILVSTATNIFIGKRMLFYLMYQLEKSSFRQNKKNTCVCGNPISKFTGET